MQAVILKKFGAPEGLVLADVAKPVPKDSEVLVKIHATTVFAGDAEIRRLKVPLVVRVPLWIYLRFFRPKPLILGQELAGEIEAAGAAVKAFKPGDQVFGTTSIGLGGYAQYKCMPEERSFTGGVLALKPANLTYAEAATIPVGGLEALHFIRRANLQDGERVLINGAGGSIGAIAVQLAKRRGAEVTAVDSAIKLDMLRAVGADHVLDFAKADYTRQGQAYDVIFDVVGKSPVARSLNVLRPRGRLLLGNPGLGQMLAARMASLGDKQIIQGSSPQPPADLRHLKDLLEAGEIKPYIDRQYALEQMAEAHRYVDEGRKRGNVAVTVAHDA